MTPEAIATAIRAAAPHADAATWATALLAPMQSSGIMTAKRIAMFIGQCAEETGGFQRFEEDLWYVSPERIQAVWPKHFPSVADAAPYIGQPEALANRVYAGILGNGDEASGDGWLFRGRGLIQLTGRLLYTDFAHAVGRSVDDLPDWLVTPEGGARSACWYWTWAYHARLLSLSDAWDIREVTSLVNGGVTNLPARVKACGAALAALAAGPAVVATHAPQSDMGIPITEQHQVVAPDPDHSADALMAAEEQSLHPAPAGLPATLQET